MKDFNIPMKIKKLIGVLLIFFTVFFTEEIAIFCRQVDIPVLRIDSDKDMEEFYTNIRYLDKDQRF